MFFITIQLFANFKYFAIILKINRYIYRNIFTDKISVYCKQDVLVKRDQYSLKNGNNHP